MRDQNGTADGRAVTMVLVDHFAQSGLVVEKVHGVKSAVPGPVIHGAVQLIGAPLGADVDHGPEGVPHGGVVGIGLELELAHRDRWRDKGDAHVTPSGIVSAVADAVDGKLRFVSAGAVHRDVRGAPRRRAFHNPQIGEIDHAWYETLQFERIAAALRQILQALVVHDLADRTGAGLKQRGVAFDLDGLGQVADLQADLQVERVADPQFEIRLPISAEPPHFRRHPVPAGGGGRARGTRRLLW